MTQADGTRRPGRPRSAEADRAILGAALELVAESGLKGMTMEAVAARAGVGKATVYRRWSSKAALYVDALESIMGPLELPPDHGSFRRDWLDILGQELDRTVPQAVRVVPRLLAESDDDEELFQLTYDALVAPRRAIGLELVRRGIRRGEIRDDLDPELIVDLLIGPIIYRALISGSSLDAIRGMTERVLDAVLPGLSAQTPAGPAAAGCRRSAG